MRIKDERMQANEEEARRYKESSTRLLRRGAALAYVLTLAGSNLYGKFVVSRTDIPFFMAFSYSVFTSIAWAALLVALSFTGHKARILSPKELPFLGHLVGLTQALYIGLWLLSLSHSDPLSFFSIFGLQYIYAMICPMFIRSKFRLSYNFDRCTTVALGIWIMVSVILTVTNNPFVQPVWAVIAVLSVGIYALDSFLRLKILLENKITAECLTLYSTIESTFWLFGMAFVLDMGVVLELPEFDMDLGWISLGAVIYFFYFVASFYFLWKTLREDRTPYSYQVSWALIAVTSPFAFGISLDPINLAGMVLTLLASAAIEFLDARLRPKPLTVEESEWVFPSDTLGEKGGNSQ